MPAYTRVLYPGSKRSLLEEAGKFFEQRECTLEQVYRILSPLAEEFNDIQADLYKSSQKLGKRNTQVVYYDQTSLFFEWEEEGGLVQFGLCKEGCLLPIVQMGLSMDRDGFRTHTQIVTRQKKRSFIAQTKKRKKDEDDDQ